MKKEYESPVYHVRRVPVEKVRANSYNPNHVAPPEMKLLELSIWEDGYTMPCVCYYIPDEDVYELVDGYHRYCVLRTSKRRLASSIKKTQKRANALKNITIPMYDNLVYTITNALEEKEREEFTRLKVIKRMKNK